VQAILNEQISTVIKFSVKTGQASREKILLPGNAFGENQHLNEVAWVVDTARLKKSGDESLYRVLISDVTAEHKTDQIKREFVANASHELRTPLSIINGYLENLVENDLIEDKQLSNKILKSMQKHGSRLAALVEDMLSISKLESGEGSQLDITKFDLIDVFRDVKEKLNVLTHETGSRIHIDLKEEVKLSGDKFYWEQILFNLTENALKQNNQQSIKVTLSASLTPEHRIITVSDTGKGIPAAHVPYIFNRFYRVQKHHSQNEIKGTGLGLSIVKRAVEAHHGTISVDSIPNVLTTFTITIPR